MYQIKNPLKIFRSVPTEVAAERGRNYKYNRFMQEWITNRIIHPAVCWEKEDFGGKVCLSFCLSIVASPKMAC